VAKIRPAAGRVSRPKFLKAMGGYAVNSSCDRRLLPPGFFIFKIKMTQSSRYSVVCVSLRLLLTFRNPWYIIYTRISLGLFIKKFFKKKGGIVRELQFIDYGGLSRLDWFGVSLEELFPEEAEEEQRINGRFKKFKTIDEITDEQIGRSFENWIPEHALTPDEEFASDEFGFISAFGTYHSHSLIFL